jgi:N4-gp56 family major capsid protein
MNFGQGGQTGSSVGPQINDKYYDRVAVTEAKKKKIFSQLGTKITQPKHYGDTIVKYHKLPILHPENINDQGIDANGMTMVPGKWYSYNADGSLKGTHNSKKDAVANADSSAGEFIKSGEGNFYGGSKDILVQDGAWPVLNEEGGRLNRVGYKRKEISAKVKEYGFFMDYTKKSLDMDTEEKLFTELSAQVGETMGDLREMMIRNSLLAKGAENATYAGDATSMGEVGAGDLISIKDLRLMDKALTDSRCPLDTKIIDGSTKFGTSTVSAARYVYVPYNLVTTLEDMTITVGGNTKEVWVPVEQYAAAGKIADGEVGKIGKFRFIAVNDMPIYEAQGADATDSSDDDDASNRYKTVAGDGKEHYDVYPLLFVGSESFAVVGFEGDVAKVQIAKPEPIAKIDPHGKVGSIAIDWYFGMMYLRPEWIRVIYTASKIY